MDGLLQITARYGDRPFCDLNASQQAEYLTELAKLAAKLGGEQGATSVLNKLGLNDDNAPGDIKDIRDLLRALRVLRRGATDTIFKGAGKLIGWLFLFGIGTLFLRSETAKHLLHIMD